MSAWQSAHLVLAFEKTRSVWHWRQATPSCMPRKGKLVLSWSNSGTLRIGFQAVKVWQFWQGRFRLPWGLRVDAMVCAEARLETCACACPGTTAPEPFSRNQTNRFSSIEPKISRLFSRFHAKRSYPMTLQSFGHRE